LSKKKYPLELYKVLVDSDMPHYPAQFVADLVERMRTPQNNAMCNNCHVPMKSAVTGENRDSKGACCDDCCCPELDEEVELASIVGHSIMRGCAEG
jgi:hypothetical protein